jgi:hypothetical protein
MPRGRKRKIASNIPSSASKRVRKISSDVDRDAIAIDEDEDLDAILARIKEQEESEKLALKLQDEWNHSSGSGDIVLSDEPAESDEALARRLAKEWGNQVDGDIDPIPGPSNIAERDQGFDDIVEISKPVGPQTRPSELTRPSYSRSKTYSTLAEGGTPDTKLSQFRDLFTANKKCTKCGKAVKSPRGHVREYFSFAATL